MFLRIQDAIAFASQAAEPGDTVLVKECNYSDKEATDYFSAYVRDAKSDSREERAWLAAALMYDRDNVVQVSILHSSGQTEWVGDILRDTSGGDTCFFVGYAA